MAAAVRVAHSAGPRQAVRLPVAQCSRIPASRAPGMPIAFSPTPFSHHNRRVARTDRHVRFSDRLQQRLLAQDFQSSQVRPHITTFPVEPVTVGTTIPEHVAPPPGVWCELQRRAVALNVLKLRIITAQKS